MFSPDLQHDAMLRKKPLLRFDGSIPFEEQQNLLRERLRASLGDEPEPVEPRAECELTEETEQWACYRIVFNAEEHVKAVCSLLMPKTDRPVGLAVCMQGHTTGMHISLGKTVFPRDKETSDRNIAFTALSHGFAALCVEQRGMGERRTDRCLGGGEDDGLPRCRYTAVNAILLGRTLLGERIFDISRSVDVALSLFPQLDEKRLIITGNSGGGTASFYAACMDTRFAACMPNGAFCSYLDSIAEIWHCPCNYLPGSAKYFDMGDLAALIAPRGLIVVYGDEDPIFPLRGVEANAGIARSVYTAAGAPERFMAVRAKGGHRYYKEETWSAFEAMRVFG